MHSWQVDAFEWYVLLTNSDIVQMPTEDKQAMYACMHVIY